MEHDVIEFHQTAVQLEARTREGVIVAQKTQIKTIERAVVSRKKGLTAHEIADKFGFNEGSVRTQLGRLRTLRVIEPAPFKRLDKETGRQNTVWVAR